MHSIFSNETCGCLTSTSHLSLKEKKRTHTYIKIYNSIYVHQQKDQEVHKMFKA